MTYRVVVSMSDDDIHLAILMSSRRGIGVETLCNPIAWPVHLPKFLASNTINTDYNLVGRVD